MKISRNLLFFLFLPAFVILYVASNTQNTLMGTIGIALVLLNAVSAVVMQR
jgi:hypothetical protein